MQITNVHNYTADRSVSFGHFQLYVTQSLLETSGIPLILGARAFDILTVLVEHAGNVVGKRDLMARVWPDVNVDEGSLRVQISALRKALREGDAGMKYVMTVAG